MRHFLWFVMATAMVISAQAPLPEALRAARTVYLEQGAGMDQKKIDRVAKELQKDRSHRLTLVGDKRGADVIMRVSFTSITSGTLAAPIAGVGVVAVPITDEKYVLIMYLNNDGAEGVWSDRDGNAAKLVRRLLDRLQKSR